MRAAGLVMLVGLVCLVVGCRTSQPDIQPPKQPELANSPPMADPRYATSRYPKEAFNNQDFLRQRALEAGNAVIPARGMMNPGGGMNPGRPY